MFFPHPSVQMQSKAKKARAKATLPKPHRRGKLLCVEILQRDRERGREEFVWSGMGSAGGTPIQAVLSQAADILGTLLSE